MVMHPKDTDVMINSVNPDHEQSHIISKIWIYTVCPDMSVCVLRIITVPVRQQSLSDCQ